MTTTSSDVFLLGRDVLDAVLAELLSKVLGVGNGESDLDTLVLELLSYLDDTIAHVVGALDVSDIVDIVVDKDDRSGSKVSNIVGGTVTDQAVNLGLNESLDLVRVGRARVDVLGGQKLDLETRWLIDDNLTNLEINFNRYNKREVEKNILRVFEVS